VFKFLHAADIHLDSPLVGLEHYDGAPVEEMRQATRRALEKLVQLALDEQVAFVLIAGDLYDRGWRDYATGLHFVAQIRRLHSADIPVFVIAGNHDAANKMTKILRFQADVIFEADRPQTRRLDHLEVAIHGQSFAQEAVLEDLSQGYPKPITGWFNIGLLHTCATVSGEHERYAPCTIDGLCAKAYDYWALGHIHKRQILHADPHIAFPGNVQGRNIRETGPKGCLLVTVNDQRRVATEFRPLDVLRWEKCYVDATGAADGDAVLERVKDELECKVREADGLPLAVRIEISGTCTAHNSLHANPPRWVNEIRSQAPEIGGGQIWIEKVKLKTELPATAQAGDDEGPLAEVRSVLQELRSGDGALERIRDDLADLVRKLPPELQDGEEAVKPGDLTWLRSLLEQVEPFLVSQLITGRDVP
jgi:DNA repair exonuclease SbcCD nuclease subunit